MRTKNSIINILFAVFSYIILFFGPFFVIPFIKNYIGTDVLGLEKTFIDVVYFARLGTIYGVYKLYKPIANNDIPKITVFLSFYKKLLTFAAFFVISLGFIFIPFVPQIVRTVDSSKLLLNPQIIFLLYVLDVALTYLFGHKRAMIIADQKNYITVLCRVVCRVLMYSFQAFVVYFFRSFSLYVIIKVFSTFLESIFINLYYKKFYGHIPTKTDLKMLESDKLDLFRTLKAVLCHKYSYEAIFSGTVLIMTGFLSATVTGMYYPYAQIASGLITINAHVFNAVVSSFGNYLVEKKPSEAYQIYKKIYFFNFWIFSFFSTVIICVSSIFVSIWVGIDSLLPLKTIVLIAIYFYFLGMRQSIAMAKSSAGLFQPDKYFAILEPILNIFLAWLFVGELGINGILLANIATSFLIPFWTQPYLVYKNIFKKSCIFYYKKYIMYFLLMAFECTLSCFMCSFLVKCDIYLRLFFNMFICLILPNLINYFIFKNTDEFNYLKNLLLKIIKNKFFIKLKGEKNAFEKK